MRFFLLALIFLIPAKAYPQAKAPVKKTVASSPRTKVIAAAKRMDDALVRKDYATFVETTYPAVLEHTEGGKERLATSLTVQVAGMEKSGNKILAAWPGEPSAMVDTAGELQCTIPQFMKLTVDIGTLVTETTLIGLSPDKGNTWYFVDAIDRPLEKIREMLPNISSRLVIKKNPQPKVELSDEYKDNKRPRSK